VSILLYRIDERLIHGQVVIGWGAELRPARFIVVDDELAGSEWEQELYSLGLPSGMEVVFATVRDARARLSAWASDDTPSVLLTRDIDSMVVLGSEGGLAEVSVNIGGIHHAPGRTDVLSYVYLSDEDREALVKLDLIAGDVSARDLPASPKVPLQTLLKTG
jgi:PTS system mannose-specific IIB component/fructoselysine and glucoselysine-specific PTS system IIB component